MKILIAIEDKIFGEAIAHFVANSRWPESTEIKIIHVMEPFNVDVLSSDQMSVLNDQRHRDAKDLLLSISTQLNADFPNRTIEQDVLEGRPKEVILSTAINWPADLIVLGSHGRHGIGQFFLGSVSLSVLSASPCSLMIVKLPR